MSKIKISKPERLPRDGITDVDFQTWKNELINYLNQDDSFDMFTARGFYSTWTAAEVDEHRIATPAGQDTDADLPMRRKSLHNFLTITAGCCYKDHYMTILQQATSFEWIWQEIKSIYQITHRGKDFLNIVDIKWDPATMNATTVYNAYRAKIMENLKPKDTVVAWKSLTMPNNEVLSPTFEDHILISVLQLIDNRLPAKVREIYGPRMDNKKFLMDFKQDILTNTAKMLEDMESNEVQVNAISQQFNRVRFQNRRPNQRQSDRRQQFNANNLFCRLCHTSRRPRNVVTSHEIGDLTCPSLSDRDKAALKSKGIATAAVISNDLTEEEELAELARQHGYEDELVNDQQHEQVQQPNQCPTNFISPVPSQILSLYQNDNVIHIDLDSGSWVSCVKLDYAKHMGWKIYPNDQLAKLADNQTVLKSVGEVRESMTRNNWTVKFEGLVLPNLHTDVIGGNNFMKDNNIEQKINANSIVVHGKYVVPETNRNVTLPTHINNIIVTTHLNKVILPEQAVTVPVPFQDDTIISVEPRSNNKLHNWPTPQICTVKNGNIEIDNDLKQPLRPGKANHQLQIRSTKQYESQNPEPGYKYTPTSATQEDYTTEIKINEAVLTSEQKQKLHDIITTNKDVFNKDLSKGYNHHAGKHFCKLNWSSKQRPSSRKVICPNYNTHLNSLLQDVCDELTQDNVLGIPQNDNVTVQCISPCFLRRKQRAKDKPTSELTKKDVRLVVNTNVVSQHLKNIPSKITKPQEVYAALSKWKYVMKTDLYQGFFQNHLHPDAYQWCAIQTPYGGIRYFKRSIQGLVGQTEEQDENLAKVLLHLLKTGKCVKIADDIFAGGETLDEAIENFDNLLTTINNNNLKLSPAKTVLFPKQVDILSWVWNQGGYLSPSPHRRQALADTTTDNITTIKDLRSWLGLYKTFIDCTPGLTALLDPFDAIVGGKDSKDKITWTPQLQQQFNQAQAKIPTMTNLYLPRPDDQLIVTCDGARTPPAVGMVLQAKKQDGSIKIVRYYSVKLKDHHLKWFPCELEATALGTAIEAFYEFIKNSTKPVIICPDNKAVVDAAKKIAKGHFSLSPRIQTFLNNLGKINHEIQHISGKSGHNAAGDFQSRNASPCSSELCQICNYVNSHADTIIDVKLNTISDIQQSSVPFLNRTTWKHIQEKDKACTQAKHCLTTGQTPSKKSGKINVETRRITDKASIANDGLLVVKQTIPLSATIIERIVVPSAYVDSLLLQIHNNFQHPAKSQLTHMFNKYFFAQGSSAAIDTLYETCQLCKASQSLPKQLYEFKTETNAKQPGTHFNVDVLKRARQKIMMCTDQFSSFVTATFIPDETAPSLHKGLLQVIQAIRHPGKVIIRTDSAPGFKSINNSKTLADLNIHIELGEPLNKNSNACVDKSMAEINQEIKKLVLHEDPIDEAVLAKAVINLNSKLRRNGQLSASNILFSRDRLSNKNLDLHDENLANDQLAQRTKNNRHHNATSNNQTIKPGDVVMRKENPQKHHVRDSYLVTQANPSQVTMQKIMNPYQHDRKTSLKNIAYKIQPARLMKTTKTYVYNKPPINKQTRNRQNKAWTPFRDVSSESDTDTDFDDQQTQHNQHRAPDTEPINIQEFDNPDDPNLTDTASENEIGFVSAEQSPTANTGAIPKRRTHVKEKWTTRQRSSSRKAAKACNDRLQTIKQKGTLVTDGIEQPRTSQQERQLLISPLDMERQYTSEDNNTSDNDDDVQEPSLDWDDAEEAISPSFLDQAFLQQPPHYPELVAPGQVYNFDHLPPLPLSVTSPPPAQAQPVTSTPKQRHTKPKTKKRMLKGLKKLF